MMTMIDQFKNLRRKSVPIALFQTTDQAAVQQAIITQGMNGGFEKVPALRWDCVTGIQPLNDRGKKALAALKLPVPPEMVLDPAAVFTAMQNLPEDGLLFVANAQRFIDQSCRGPEAIACMQALWNLRDTFKLNGRTVLLLSAGAVQLPSELANDIVVIDDPRPNPEQLKAIVLSQYVNAELPTPSDEVAMAAVDACRGLPAFTTEQLVAMNLRKSGLDQESLWAKKIETVNRTRGLTFCRPNPKDAAIGGAKNARLWLGRLQNSPIRPRVIVLLDEIEKQFAGSTGGGDRAASTLGQMGQVLSWMDGPTGKRTPGAMLFGPAGSGKTLLGRWLSALLNVPLLIWNIGESSGMYQGDDAKFTREAIDVIDAVGDGQALVIATCNGTASIPPEMQRRFNLLQMFVDLPNDEERLEIWEVAFDRYDLDRTQVKPDDHDWTGAEINACDYKAWAFGMPLVEAAKTISPVARAMGARLTALRQEAASAGYISSAYEGAYQMPVGTVTGTPDAPPAPRTRRVATE